MTELTKQCPGCLDTKTHDMFKMKKGKPTYCKLCWNSKMRGKRSANRTSGKRTDLSCMSIEERKKHQSVQRRKAKRRMSESNKRYLWDMLVKASCVDCGHSDPLVLQFDHRDPAEKSGDISDLMHASPKKLKTEIAKCDIVCAHCHIHRTARMFGSWRLAYMQRV